MPKVEKKELVTVSEYEEYKGHKLLKIFEVDEEGRKDKYPLHNFGKKKAQAILNHLEDIKALAGVQNGSL